MSAEGQLVEALSDFMEDVHYLAKAIHHLAYAIEGKPTLPSTVIARGVTVIESGGGCEEERQDADNITIIESGRKKG